MIRVTKADPVAIALADRHYSRQTKGAQVGQPGRCLVLLGDDEMSLFVWNWPFEQYAKHGFGDRQICTLFRNESSTMSSCIIIAAEQIALGHWGPARDGFLTFVDAGKVRRKRDPGRCFLRAGWQVIGRSKSGLIALGK